jgi:glycolate oxidase iron-sulfur subunit
LWANEADSPRGRIVLIGEGLDSADELSNEMVTHFDRCLGCMACVTACPSGVRYDRLIERVRPQVERRHKRTSSEQALRLLLFETLPYPSRLRKLAPMLAAAHKIGAARLGGRLGTLAKLAPRRPGREARRIELPERTPAVGEPRGRVGLLLGCVQRVFYPEVHRATIGALSAEGFEVLAPRVPDCCGALEFHAGEEDAAVARARSTIAAFDALGELDYVLTGAAGCGSAMKEYGELLDTPEAREFASRVRDVSEVLASVEPVAPRGPVPIRVVYHDACHLAHA